MFALAFRNLLPPPVVDELDQLVAGIRGYLSTQHNEDGSHGAVTATSVAVASDDPTFSLTHTTGSNLLRLFTTTYRWVVSSVYAQIGTAGRMALVADYTGATAQVIRFPLGEMIAGLWAAANGPTGAVGPAIVWTGQRLSAADPITALRPAWGIGPASDATVVNGYTAQLGIFDSTNDQLVAKVWRDQANTGAGTYLISPDGDHGPLGAVYLGDRSNSRYRWADVAASLLYSAGLASLVGGVDSGSAWAAKAVNTVYGPAAADGFAVVKCAGASGSGGNFDILTDASNPPTTSRWQESIQNSGYSSACCPVRKGDYWKVVDNQTGTAPTYTVYWLGH